MKKGVALFLAVILMGCKPDPDPIDTFDRGSMLANITDELIMPNYSELTSSLTAFSSAMNDFYTDVDNSATPTLPSTELKELYIDWLHCAVYEIGPAETQGLRAAFNTFPTDTTALLNNIASGNTTMGTAATITTSGLPALEYLFFRRATEAEVISFLSETNTRIYVNAIIDYLETKLSNVTSSWNSGYATTFKSMDGTDQNGSVNVLYNALSFDWELIKNAQIGIPLGTQSLGITRPYYVQAPYSDWSNELSATNVNAIANLFNGVNRFSGTNYLSFDDYLNEVRAEGSADLNANMNTLFTEIEADINGLSLPLRRGVDEDPAPIQSIYNKIQQQVANIKTNMASELGLLIVYTDNDGD